MNPNQNLIAVHAGPNSTTVLRFVEIESLSADFQNRINAGECYGLFEAAAGKIFMDSNDGSVYEQA